MTATIKEISVGWLGGNFYLVGGGGGGGGWKFGGGVYWGYFLCSEKIFS